MQNRLHIRIEYYHLLLYTQSFSSYIPKSSLSGMNLNNTVLVAFSADIEEEIKGYKEWRTKGA